jgi:hypothetical protein
MRSHPTGACTDGHPNRSTARREDSNRSVVESDQPGVRPHQFLLSVVVQTVAPAASPSVPQFPPTGWPHGQRRAPPHLSSTVEDRRCPSPSWEYGRTAQKGPTIMDVSGGREPKGPVIMRVSGGNPASTRLQRMITDLSAQRSPPNPMITGPSGTGPVPRMITGPFCRELISMGPIRRWSSRPYCGRSAWTGTTSRRPGPAPGWSPT